MANLYAKDLSFRYGNHNILKDINVLINKGSFVSILGPNGCGKTTFLKNLCNLLKPYNGAVYIDDNDILNFKHQDFAKKMAVVHQSTSVDFDFSVFEVVLMGRIPYQKKFRAISNEDITIAEDALKKTETWHLRDKGISEVSGGERQRIIIARALAQRTEVLLLDEPISNLDIKYQVEILRLCKELKEKKELTIVTTMHDINLAAAYSDYIILISKGEVKIADTPQNVVTPQNIQDVYGIKVKIIRDIEDNSTYIFPLEL